MAADSRRYGLNAQLDIEQILLEAQHRWLRPAEICEILRNYNKFQIAPEPPNKPPSGSLFLFDRKVLRYFRKDGHNWRKKRDGKTVKEAHERLKAGSIDVLHCYYAHGEGNENFQRRSYWMLEEELSHIVLVHYREVKGNRTNFNRIKEAEEAVPDFRETEDDVPNSEVDSSASSKFHPYDYQVTSQITDATSLNIAQASEYEDAESAYNQQTSSGFHSFLESQPAVMQKTQDGLAVPYYPVSASNNYQGQYSDVAGMNFASVTQGDNGRDTVNTGSQYPPQTDLFPSWENVLRDTTAGYQSVHFQQSLSSDQSDRMSMREEGNVVLGQEFMNDFGKKQEYGMSIQGLEEWQTSVGDALDMSKWSMDPKLHPDSLYRLTEVNHVDLHCSVEPYPFPAENKNHSTQNELQARLTTVSDVNTLKPDSDLEGKVDYPTLRQQPRLGGVLREGLKKLDSFDRWISKELEDVSETHMQTSSGAYWETVGNENGVDTGISSQVQLDTYVLSPLLSQEQLFSIIDFSPSWAYAGSEIKVLITGKFLRNGQEVEKYKWACMFAELEVPAEVIADGVLRCHTPVHKAERVPFYITCSNRLACSEVREFEFRDSVVKDVDIVDVNSGNSSDNLLHMRFGKLLSLGSAHFQSSSVSSLEDTSHVCSKVNLLLKEDNNEWELMLNFTSEDGFSVREVKDQLLQKLLKEKLRLWLLQKVAEGGKGASVLDDGGQGVLHFAAALGYDWAIPATVSAGVSVNFRDVNGWTALHWAALYGRERTVGFLISIGAAPGALTDPTPKYPAGRTPADLASSNGHKGIAGYLAELALSSHLSSLKLKDGKERDNGETLGLDTVQTISERSATPLGDGDYLQGSLKDSLAAVRNATQAAARIHQVFRVQSFQRKQLEDYNDGDIGMSEERALSLAMKANKGGQHDEPLHAAAVRIQNKFRGWKGRKEFLLIRQRIIKIQAHVRGHQVRKNYRKIIWSVGILDKVILRWRRKGSGLRGFRSEAVTEGPSTQKKSVPEDEYDFLRQGRKQTEERLQKALARVKSMVQYPEARDQYRRLLNVVSEMQQTQTVYDGVLNSTDEATDFEDDLIDLDALLDEDTFMSTAS